MASKEFASCHSCGGYTKVADSDGTCCHCGALIDISQLGEGGPYKASKILVSTDKELSLDIETDDAADGIMVFAPIALMAELAADGTVFIKDRPVTEQGTDGLTDDSGRISVSVGGGVTGSVNIAKRDINKVGNIIGSTGVAIGSGNVVNIGTSRTPGIVVTVRLPQGTLRKLSVTAPGGTVWIQNGVSITEARFTNLGKSFNVVGGLIGDFRGHSLNGQMNVRTKVTGDHDVVGDVLFA